jgi:hypothetical protein
MLSMSNKTRYFVLAAGAILTVGLTTGLVASYMGGLPVAFSRAAGPDELRYVPPTAAVVAYANVRDVMGSKFRERFRKLEPDTSERDEFQQKTGVNIEQDIHTVVAAVMPGSTTDGWSPAKGMLVIARGRFEQSRLEALAVEHGGKVDEYQGKRLLTHVNESGAADVAMGFIDADIIAFGSFDAVKQAIDAGAGNNITSNLDLMRQINDLESNTTWAVGRFDAIAQSANLPSEVKSRLPDIQWFSAAGHVNGGLSGVFKAEARDEQSAQNMRDVLRGFLALAKMQAGDRPEFQAVVDSLQLSGDGRNVAVSFTLPSELLDAMEALANQHKLPQ